MPYKKLKLEELNRISEEEFRQAKKNPIVIVLDNIRSMHNVGSAFRTADAFLCEKIILTGITAQPPHRDIHKTALGAENAVNWEHAEKTEDALKQLKQEGYTIAVVEQAENSTPLQDFKPSKDENLCLVFGNEVFGVTDEAMALTDACIEIPQYGSKHSLNVSVSLGVVLWEVVKKI